MIGITNFRRCEFGGGSALCGGAYIPSEEDADLRSLRFPPISVNRASLLYPFTAIPNVKHFTSVHVEVVVAALVNYSDSLFSSSTALGVG